MKKFRSFLFMCLIILGFLVYNSQKATTSINQQNCRVYFVDRQLHKLVSVPIASEKNIEKTADKIISEIISGRDYNPEILRIVPDIEDGISVRISGEIAYVNLSGKLLGKVNISRDTEKLLVYQIVNSLTSIDGVEYVSFAVDGEPRKDFLGFIDMRGLFTPDYDI